ncbi:MAG: hypothetical protein V3S82_10235 [Dehalococcoidia bacterium]
MTKAERLTRAIDRILDDRYNRRTDDRDVWLDDEAYQKAPEPSPSK